jgi:competence protein ComEA
VFQRFIPAVVLFASIVFVHALAHAQAPGAPGKPLPPGPMQEKVKAECTQCHEAGRITKQHKTRQQWSAELVKMEGMGAVIPDADRDDILNYLTENFGPAKGGAKTAPKKSGSTGD